jgi:uncharacterized membrane protein
VAFAGVVLFGVGWRLRDRRPGYALALEGGAAGILYLTVFTALRLYSLLPPSLAFVLLALLAAASAVLAVLQSSQAFALLAVLGGFLAPVLASTGQGSHVVLFGYYSILDVGILVIAWFKAWRSLNLAGFLFTFVIATAWGVLRYQPELFTTTEPFLVLFFLLYVAVAVLFSLRQPPQLRGYVDATLVFGTPMLVFALQSAMVHGRAFGLASSAVVLGMFYLALAWGLRHRALESHDLLIEAFQALATLFLTLAVPLALDGRWTAATWAMEGAALVWIGCRQSRRWPRAFGMLLQVAAGVVFWHELQSMQARVPVLNSEYLGGVIISAGSTFCAALLERNRTRLLAYEQQLPAALFSWALVWWLYCGLVEIQRWVPDTYDASVSLLFLTATALAGSEMHQRLKLAEARLPALGLLPAMIFYAALARAEVNHPLADGGWFAWPLAFVALYFLYHRHEGPAERPLATTLHVAAAWLLVALASWEVAWAIDTVMLSRGSWPVIAWAVAPAAALFALPRLIEPQSWPVGRHHRAYTLIAGGGVAVYLTLWSLIADLDPSDAYPLPYLPLLNPLDFAQFWVLAVLLRYWVILRATTHPSYVRRERARLLASLAILTFLWLNAVLLRALHHWAGVPYELAPLLRSTLVQTTLSIFWTTLALGMMLVATRRATRVVWLAGGALLIAVIVKLFLVDLSRSGTIERIVSFVGVGLLMLVIGYFSPLPPASRSDGAA